MGESASNGADVARLRLVVGGRVQGVGFRYGTLDRAKSLRLTGWVRNCSNGTVEVLAEGAREQLQQLERWCHDGPRGALVSRVDAEWLRATGEFTTFAIERSNARSHA